MLKISDAGKTHKIHISNKKCKKQNNCWTEYKEIGTLAHCQEEYKTWQPVWNSYGMYFLEKLKIEFHSTQYTTFKI